MADKNVRVHRLVSDITAAPTGFDAQLDSVCRAVSLYFSQGMAAYLDGTASSAPADDATSLKNHLLPSFPGAAVTNNTVWVWIINEVTGQRQLWCYSEETVLTQEKHADGSVMAINPPIGVRVEQLMTIGSASSGWTMPA